MQSGGPIELDSMELEPQPNKRPAFGTAGNAPFAQRRPPPGPVTRAADEEILLDDDDSDDSFDDASINDTETIASSVATPPMHTVRPPSSTSGAAVPASLSTSSDWPMTRNPSAGRNQSLFSKLMKRGGSRDESPSAGAEAPPAPPPQEGGRLRRYSAANEGGANVPTTSGNGASLYPRNVPNMAEPPSTPDSSGPPPVRAGPPAAPGSQSTPRGSSSTRGRLGRPSQSRPSRPGVKVVRVTGATPRSVQALIFYLYTSQVHFVASPNQSPHSDANSLHEEASELLGDGSKQSPSLWPPAFSSKAAYCLGQQLELRDLSLRAFDHLTLNLSPRTVLADLLSPFGDRFPEVQRAHLDFITLHWEEVKTRPDFGPTIENLVHGQYPNSSKSLFQLFSKLSIRSF